MQVYRIATLVIVGMTVSAAASYAQKSVAVVPGAGFKITESAPIEVTPVKNAPFSAQAVTEFAQALEDGNRIERRYESSVARDTRGRTRREEEIALIGPFFTAANAGAPRLVTIIDPDAGVTYTLDEEQRVAFRSSRAGDKTLVELTKLNDALKTKAVVVEKGGGGRGAAAEIKKAERALDQPDTVEKTTTQDLGSRMIEGVRAQGTRTTTTIPTGAIGNVRPIEIVSERWFSAELQMPVLITRRDPRNGETTYRLTNIVRGEQQDGLFTVPAGYETRDGNLKFKLLEVAKTKKFVEVTGKQ
jgi:hypothetical protein